MVSVLQRISAAFFFLVIVLAFQNCSEGIAINPSQTPTTMASAPTTTVPQVAVDLKASVSGEDLADCSKTSAKLEIIVEGAPQSLKGCKGAVLSASDKYGETIECKPYVDAPSNYSDVSSWSGWVYDSQKKTWKYSLNLKDNGEEFMPGRYKFRFYDANTQKSVSADVQIDNLSGDQSRCIAKTQLKFRLLSADLNKCDTATSYRTLEIFNAGPNLRACQEFVLVTPSRNGETMSCDDSKTVFLKDRVGGWHYDLVRRVWSSNIAFMNHQAYVPGNFTAYLWDPDTNIRTRGPVVSIRSSKGTSAENCYP